MHVTKPYNQKRIIGGQMEVPYYNHSTIFPQSLTLLSKAPALKNSQAGTIIFSIISSNVRLYTVLYYYVA